MLHIEHGRLPPYALPRFPHTQPAAHRPASPWADLNRSESSQMLAGLPRRAKNEKTPWNWGRDLEQFSESEFSPYRGLLLGRRALSQIPRRRQHGVGFTSHRARDLAESPIASRT